jgi:hypothetical protein
MTDRELMQQALDALEGLLGWQSLAPTEEQDDAKAAAFQLRARLAQPEQEQDGECQHCNGSGCSACHSAYLVDINQQREWQGLTDEEETELIKKWAGELVFEVTQALKEKNT